MASVAKLRGDLAEMRSKYRGALARVRNSPKAKKTTDLAVQVGGSAIAGYVATTQYSKIAGFDSALLLGGGLVAYSMFSKNSNVTNMAGLIGIGMLNGYVYKKVLETRGFVQVSQEDLNLLINASQQQAVS